MTVVIVKFGKISWARFVYFICRMRYVAAYLLAALGGKDNPNSADIEKILSSVGIEAEGEKLKKVISELNGKNIEELIAAGNFILKIGCKMWGSLQLC